jgi:hypothetical protein
MIAVVTTAARSRGLSGTVRSVFLHTALAALTLASACGGGESPATRVPGTQSAASANPAAGRPSEPKPVVREYDLAADEPLGGHTLQRHVGRTDAELAARLDRERDISAASTYTDAATARRVVAAAIDRNRGRLATWVERSGPRPNLVLQYRDPSGAIIGRTLERGARSTKPCTSALVVIRWLDRVGRWFVLTSYPEAG